MLRFLLFSLSFLVSFSAFSTQPVVRIAIPPGWITNVTPDYGSIPNGKEMTAGYYYLLSNCQERTRLKQQYNHVAVKVLNSEGVQSLSDISVDFDPAYEQLIFHKIQLIRNGTVINKLNKDKIKVIQREVNLERFMYDGTQTAVINLMDVRVNDIIEYAWSVTGYNPIFAGRFSDNLPLEFGAPVKHLYRRLIVPAKEHFNFRYMNGAPQAVVAREGDEISYLWEAKEVPAVTFDINTPAWYDPLKHVNVSDYSSWAEVANWGLNVFAVTKAEKEELEKRIAEVVCRQPADSVVIQSIRFVQDRIRYLAFEDGLNSHRPDHPIKVMDQLYGDCKSKSLLLAEMLKIRGIDAWPVLVNGQTGKVLGEKLPSPYAFNHCVTGFKVNGKNWYVDPSISNQGGDIEHLYFPSYFWGLDLRPGVDALTPLPPGTYASTKVREQFTLDKIGGGATLKVTSVYKGGDADYQRGVFASTNASDVSKAYQNFYSALFPTIRPLFDVVVRDQRSGENSLVVEEHYTIDSIWKRSVTDPNVLVCEFYPLSFANLITGKKSPARTMPYRLSYPIECEHQTVVDLPEEWTVRDDVIDRGSDVFQYHHTIHYDDRRLNIVHLYRTLADFVPPDKVEPFLAALQEVNTHLTYRLTYNASKAVSNGISWFSWIVALIVAGISFFFARKIYLRPCKPLYSPGFQTRQIGGWLIYFAFVITLTPVRMGWQLFYSSGLFNSQIWEVFADLDGSLRNFVWAIILFFELVLNMALLVFSILAALMLYKRRMGFPRFYIWLLIVTTVVTVTDTLVVNWLEGTSASAKSSAQVLREVFPWIIYAGIAIRYFLVSRRVRETFTEPSARPPVVLPVESHEEPGEEPEILPGD